MQGSRAMDTVAPLRSAEEQLDDARRRLEAALAAGAIGTFRWDIRTHRLEWDERLDRLFGLRPNEAVRSLEQFLQRVHPADRAEVVERCERCARDGADFEMDFRVLLPDGSVRWLADRGRTVLDDTGRPAFMTGACVDITERKLAEERLQEEARISDTLNRIGSLLAIKRDLHNVLQTVTDEATRLTGAAFGAFFYNAVNAHGEAYLLYTLSGAPREAFARFSPPRNTPLFAPTFRGEGVVRCDDVTRDPRYGANPPHRGMPAGHLPVRSYLAVPVVTSAGEVLGGLFFGHPEPAVFKPRHETLIVGVAGQAAIAIDNARLYERLRDSAERLSLALSASNLGDWSWNASNDVVTFSDRAAEIFGIPSGPFMTWTRMRDLIDPEDRERVRLAVETAVASRERYDVEYRVHRPDGSRVWVSARGSAHYDDSGKPIGMVGVVQDMTGRREMEEELSRRAKELAAADRRKDEFLATLAHELRNPLAPLRSALDLLGQVSEHQNVAGQARAIMERQLRHMVRLVDDLLDLSRVSTGRIELRLETAELAAIVHGAVETSRPLIEQGGHHLSVRLPPEPLFLKADVTRLAQVFSNLLNNAAKYTPRGGRIELAVEAQDGFAAVHVRDSGVGIPAHMVTRVFDMFVQVDRSLEKSHGGLGIGLTIVKQLVDMHGGWVAARSEGPGRGSEFTVRLPLLHERPDAGSAAPMTTPRAARAARRILVADDNVEAATSLAMLLQLMGHEVQAVHSGPDAVSAGAEHRPQIVILDIGMPGMNGYDACREMRQQPWAAEAVFIALSGWGQDEHVERARAAGFHHHLVKPVEFEVLRDLVGAAPQRASPT
ncbi:MAG TPA: PAS domain-containing protein [Burkholderiales bacterium]|nr:PAS domain-containing protein [Burkholderiales bacterium]